MTCPVCAVRLAEEAWHKEYSRRSEYRQLEKERNHYKKALEEIQLIGSREMGFSCASCQDVEVKRLIRIAKQALKRGAVEKD